MTHTRRSHGSGVHVGRANGPRPCVHGGTSSPAVAPSVEWHEHDGDRLDNRAPATQPASR
eukprot:scaffold43492_cov23-Tisochrysis_lutea.AAC.5